MGFPYKSVAQHDISRWFRKPASKTPISNGSDYKDIVTRKALTERSTYITPLLNLTLYDS